MLPAPCRVSLLGSFTPAHWQPWVWWQTEPGPTCGEQGTDAAVGTKGPTRMDRQSVAV